MSPLREATITSSSQRNNHLNLSRSSRVVWLQLGFSTQSQVSNLTRISMSTASRTSAKQQSKPDTKEPAPQVFKVNGNTVFYKDDANLIIITADNYKFQVDDLQIRAAR
jgi:hypothetical protein